MAKAWSLGKSANVRFWTLLVLASSACLAAHAALAVKGRHVTHIDAMPALIVIWFDGADVSALQPQACNAYRAGSCDPTEAWCQSTLALASIAQETQSDIELNFSGQCRGSFAEISRFRTH